MATRPEPSRLARSILGYLPQSVQNIRLRGGGEGEERERERGREGERECINADCYLKKKQ